jgi:hypothetical protein
MSTAQSTSQPDAPALTMAQPQAPVTALGHILANAALDLTQLQAKHSLACALECLATQTQLMAPGASRDLARHLPELLSKQTTQLQAMSVEFFSVAARAQQQFLDMQLRLLEQAVKPFSRRGAGRGHWGGADRRTGVQLISFPDRRLL